MTDLKLYGYEGIFDVFSSINVTGMDFEALIDNCTFQQNCFIEGDLGAKITLNNSTFQSYRHDFGSIVFANSSVIMITGNVHFSDSVTGIHQLEYSSGTALFLRTTHPDQKSSLNIATGATVYFINLSCSNFGGSVYAERAVINVSAKTLLVFLNNTTPWRGGALSVVDGVMNVGGVLTYEIGNTNWLNNETVDPGKYAT